MPPKFSIESIRESLDKKFYSFLQGMKLEDRRLWPYISFFALGIAAIFIHFFNSPQMDKSFDSEVINGSSSTKLPTADTFIPPGFVLIPIELQNKLALGSLIGSVGGTVDLYAAGREGKKGRIIGQKIKILRAPLDPDQYAVLVDEEGSLEILEHDGEFIAILHNPKTGGGQVTRKAPAKVKQDVFIDYQDQI